MKYNEKCTTRITAQYLVPTNIAVLRTYCLIITYYMSSQVIYCNKKYFAKKKEIWKIII